MAKVRVAILGTVGRTVQFDPNATEGATLGTNLFDENGNVLSLADLASLIETEQSAGEATAPVTIAHSTLAALDQDDHLQYLLLAGRAGGQIAFGGANTGDNLTLDANPAAGVNTGRIVMRSAVEFESISETGAPYAFNYDATENYTSTFVGGGLNMSGNITHAGGTFIYESFRGAPTINTTGNPGFAAYTVLQALPTLNSGAGGGHNPLAPLILNAGVQVRHAFVGTRTVSSVAAVNFASTMVATVSGAVLNCTNWTGLTVAPKWNTAAGSTISFGNITGVDVQAPAQGLFSSSAGIERMSSFYGMKVANPGINNGFGTAPVAAIRSEISLGTNRYFLLNAGTAPSDMGAAHMYFDDNFGVAYGGAGITDFDYWESWNAAGYYRQFFLATGDEVRFSSPSADRFLWTTNGGNTVAEFNFDCAKATIGAQTGAIGNGFLQFIAPARTTTLNGDWTDVLITAAGNLTVANTMGTVATQVFNAPSITNGGGTIVTHAAVQIGGNPSGLPTTNRVGLHILSNPTGASGVNAALWLQNGPGQFDGGVNIGDGTGDNASFDHNGVDFNTAFVGTADWNITGLTGQVTVDALVQATQMIAGDPGTEAAGITVGGVTYESSLKVSDLGGTNIAQMILHRHSTTLPPILIAARSNSNDATHGIVANNDTLLSILGAGWDSVDYALGAEIRFEVDGAPGVDDMPGRIVFMTSADGTGVPIQRMTILSDGSVNIFDASGADSASFLHNGTDFGTSFVGTADWNITGLTGRILQGAETLAYVSEIAGGGVVNTDINTATPPTNEAVTGFFEIQDLAGDDPLAQFGYTSASNQLFIRQLMQGGEVQITAVDSGGIPRIILQADPDNLTLLRADSNLTLEVAAGETCFTAIANGETRLYHNNVQTTRTDSLANGGLEVNNTLTGAGWERVLTTSDLGGGVQTPWASDIDGAGFGLDNIDRLEIQAPGIPGDSVTITHNGSDLTHNFANTTWLRFTNLGSGVLFQDGAEIRIYHTDDIAYLSLSHNGTNGVIFTNTGVVQIADPCEVVGDLSVRTGNDFLIFDAANDDFLTVAHSGTAVTFATAGTGVGGVDIILAPGSNQQVVLHQNAVNVFETQQHNATGNTAGAQVKDHGGTLRDVGFNTLPQFNFNASDTLEAQHCGHVTGKDNTTAYTLTGPTSGDVDFPVDGVAHVYNLGSSVDYTLNDTATCTMFWCDGSAAPVDIAGAGVLAPGGMITLWRFSTGAIYITGSGFTP